jgi:hypothetical protein
MFSNTKRNTITSCNDIRLTNQVLDLGASYSLNACNLARVQLGGCTNEKDQYKIFEYFKLQQLSFLQTDHWAAFASIYTALRQKKAPELNIPFSRP